jgi:hypothetical protein
MNTSDSVTGVTYDAKCENLSAQPSFNDLIIDVVIVEPVAYP